MDVGSVTSNNGMFSLNGQQYDLGTLMLVLNESRMKGIDDQIAGRMGALNDRNKNVKALNELMAQLRKHKAEGRDDDNGYGGDKQGQKFELSGTDGVARDPDGWMDHFGLTKTDVRHQDDKNEKDAQWDANISAVQGKIDGLNSDSQMEMTQLQSLMNKRNTASDMTTNILATDKKAKDSIVSNLR